MRRSSNEGDAGYADWFAEHSEGKVHRIFLDGVEQRQVSMADEDLGVVDRCVLDDQGRVQINPDQPDEVWIERVSGTVEIRIEDVA